MAIPIHDEKVYKTGQYNVQVLPKGGSLIVRFKLITNSIQSNSMSPRHWYQTTRLK